MGENVNDSLFSIALLDDAWRRVKAKGGSAGVDGIDLGVFESDLSENLDSLLADVNGGVYRSQAYRAVDIPKPTGGHRRIVIATIRDRVLQTASTALLHPYLEPILHPCSYAYRQGVGVHDALGKIVEYRERGLRCVVRADVEQFFDRVNHDLLFDQIQRAGVADGLAGLVRMWLTNVIVDRSESIPNTVGLPQGLPISPLLANLYLTPFDRRIVEAGWKLVRYADDLAICCPDNANGQLALDECQAALNLLRLNLSADKSSVTSFDQGFEFLGARFQDNDLIPAVAHPYEAEFKPPPRAPRRPPVQALPYQLMRTLYLQQQGSSLGCHGKRLVVTRSEKTLLDMPAHHIDQVFVFGRINITTPAMTFCLEQGIPIHLFSGRGRYFGVIRRIADANAVLRRAQYTCADDTARRLAFATAIVRAKIANDRSLLQHHARNHPETGLAEIVEDLRGSIDRIVQCADIAQLRGIEGNAAATFYRGFARCLRGALTFTHRSRRPPTDPINSLLSFGYTILFHNCYGYMTARGFDTAIGLFHEPGRGHPALVSDLIEEFRAPVVDAVVLAVVNRGLFNPGDFYIGEGQPQPCLMQDQARVRFIEALEQKMQSLVSHPDVNHPVDWRRVMDLQILRLRRFMEGAIDHYQPYLTE